jgi:hypothetical protein
VIAAAELPLRIIDQPGGPVVRCLCGRELAQIRRSTGNNSMVGLRSSGPARPLLGSDVSPAALLVMIAHARQCKP